MGLENPWVLLTVICVSIAGFAAIWYSVVVPIIGRSNLTMKSVIIVGVVVFVMFMLITLMLGSSILGLVYVGGGIEKFNNNEPKKIN